MADSMIEFWCMYCGRPAQAEEATVLRRIACPGCGHSIPVPIKRPGEALQSAPDAGHDAPANGEDWAGKTNEEIVERLLIPPVTEEQKRRQATKMVLSPLLPRYNDLTLFALSLTFLLLALIDGDLRRDLAAALVMGPGPGPALMALLFVAVFGMVGSLFNVFLQRDKSRLERWAMLLFAVFVTAGTGIYAGSLMLGRSRGWLIVFPAWNILNGALLLVLTRAGIVDTDCIIDEKATFGQVLVTAIVVPILLTTCLYIFELHWATTFSIAVAYTMSLHNALRRVFGRREPSPVIGAR